MVSICERETVHEGRPAREKIFYEDNYKGPYPLPKGTFATREIVYLDGLEPAQVIDGIAFHSMVPLRLDSEPVPMRGTYKTFSKAYAKSEMIDFQSQLGF